MVLNYGVKMPSNYINVHVGDEVCRAYSILPGQPESKGILDWEAVLNTPFTATNGKTPLYVDVPLQGVSNATVRLQLNWYMLSGTYIPEVGYVNSDLSERIFEIAYDEDLGEYALVHYKLFTGDGYSTYFKIKALSADIWGFTPERDTLTIEYKFKITNMYANRYNPTIPGECVELVTFDHTSDPTDEANSSEIYLYPDGHIATWSNDTICKTETQYAENFTLEANTVYKVTIIVTRGTTQVPFDQYSNTYPITYEIYINDVLFYIGYIPKAYTTHTLEEGSFLFSPGTYEGNLLKNIGSIKAYWGRPGLPSFKKISILRDNTEYYLLASNQGRYPSERFKAKIDGTTYSVLLKHDLDTE